MNRFDIPATVSHLLDIASKTGLLDSKDIFSLGATHSDNWEGFVQEIIDIAYSDFHSEEGRKIHKKIAEAADKFYKKAA